MKIYNLPQHIKGDTFNGVEFTVTIDGTPKNLTSTDITCQFRKGKKTGSLALELTVGDGITKTDAANGVFTLDAQTINIAEGLYYYDIEFNDSGVIKTYVGGTITVIQDVTQ